MPLDFRSAAALFVGTEEELARALGLDVETLRRHRSRPGGASPTLLARLGDVLEERGRAMLRVAEMLREDATGADGNGGGVA